MVKCLLANRKKLIKAINDNEKRIRHKYLILDLIEEKEFERVVALVKKDKIKVIRSPLVPKGYLTGFEHFIFILDDFITHYFNITNSPEDIKIIITNLLKDSDILLSNKYIYDNENISFYQYEFNYLLCKKFYYNLISMKKDLRKELKKIDLSISKISIKNLDDINGLTTLLGEISFINQNSYKIFALFDDIDSTRRELYIDIYKMLLQNYIKNIDFIKKYREFKNSN